MRTVRAYLTAHWNAGLSDVSSLIRGGSLFGTAPDHTTLARTGPGQVEVSAVWEDAALSIWLLPRTREALEVGLALTAPARGLRVASRRKLTRELVALESYLRLRVETESRRRARTAVRIPATAVRMRRSGRT